MTEEVLNNYVNKIQSFNMNEDKRFDAVHIKDAVMAGYNICRSECEKSDLENAICIGALEEENTKLKAQIEKMKCCGNCKQRELIREHGQWKERFNCKGNGCVCHSKWEIKEK